jgi:hypothetical protein
VVPEFLQSFYVAGDQGDRRCLPDHGDRKGDTPHHVAARVSKFECLALGKLAKDSRPATKRYLMRSKKRAVQEKIAMISADDDPEFLRGAARVFFLAVSPSRGGLWSSTSPRMHTHRRWGGIGGRGTTADRGRRGGSRSAITTGVWLGLRERVGPPRNGDA